MGHQKSNRQAYTRNVKSFSFSLMFRRLEIWGNENTKKPNLCMNFFYSQSVHFQLNIECCYLHSHLFTFPFSFKEKGNSLIYSIVVYLCISQYLEIGLNFDFEFIFMNCLLITFICMIWTFRTTKS